MICHLCGQDRILRRSHIIPDRFTREIQGQHPNLKAIGWDEAWAKRLPGGVYQPDFLCDGCEGMTAIWEAEAARVFIADAAAWRPLEHQGATIGWTFASAELTSIRLFFVQLLLKASLSTIEPFEKVQLGPYTEAFREAVMSKDPSRLGESVGVILTRFAASQKMPGAERSIQLPARGHVAARNMYWLAFNGFGAFVRVDKRPFEGGIEKFEVGTSQELTAISRTFDDDKGIGFLVRLAGRVHAARQAKGWRT